MSRFGFSLMCAFVAVVELLTHSPRQYEPYTTVLCTPVHLLAGHPIHTCKVNYLWSCFVLLKKLQACIA